MAVRTTVYQKEPHAMSFTATARRILLLLALSAAVACSPSGSASPSSSAPTPEPPAAGGGLPLGPYALTEQDGFFDVAMTVTIAADD